MSGKFKSVWMLGVAVIGAGLLLGGCNNELKKENENLRAEQAATKERLAALEAQNQQTSGQLNSLQSENSTLKNQLATVQQPAPRPTGDEFVGSGGGGDTGSGRRSNGNGGGGRTTESVIEISSDVLFGPGSATLKPDARRELDKIVSRLKSARSIRIEGHTDSDPLVKSKAKWGSNQALSKARADAVRDYLTSKGVSRSKIATVGKGSSEPKGSKKDSRRVDIAVVEIVID